MHILIIINTIYRPRGWTAAYCAACGGVEAVRVEDKARVLSLSFLPVGSWVEGQAFRCDFCERPIEPSIQLREIDLDDWSPPDGLPTLVERLTPGASAKFDLPDEPSDERLRSLLSSAAEASSLYNIDASFGMTTGIFAGIALGALAGPALHKAGALPGSMDKFGAVFLVILIGIVAGAVLGALGQTLLGRGRPAARKIEAAWSNYDLDLDRLENLARGQPGVVQRAVRKVRDSV